MITPIKTLTIQQICKRQDDLLVSTDDIKKVAENERNKFFKVMIERKEELERLIKDPANSEHLDNLALKVRWNEIGNLLSMLRYEEPDIDLDELFEEEPDIDLDELFEEYTEDSDSKEQWIYETGKEEVEILGSGSSFCNVVTTRDENEAFKLAKESNRNYLTRTKYTKEGTIRQFYDIKEGWIDDYKGVL